LLESLNEEQLRELHGSDEMGRLNTYQKWMIGFGMIGLLIASIGVYTSFRLSHVLVEDDDIVIIPTHIPTPTNGYTPPSYHKPEMLLDSATIIPDINNAEFQISVSNPEHVVLIGMHFYVDGVEDPYTLLLENPISGVYQVTIYMNQFNYHVPNSVVIIYLIMSYITEQGGIAAERVDDVVTFSFKKEDDVPPYYPPEIISGTFEYSIEETVFTFGFSVTYHELITSIGCYFVIDDDIFEISAGEYYVVDMIHIESGYYQSFFDYMIFPLDVWIYFYLTVGYIDVEGEDDSYIVEELQDFIVYSGTANGAGTNYLFIIIIPMILVLFSIIRKVRTRRSD